MADNKPHLTGVVVQDAEAKGYTAYLLEIPEVIAEGNTEDEVKKALFENLQIVLEFRREDGENGMKGFKHSTFQLPIA